MWVTLDGLGAYLLSMGGGVRRLSAADVKTYGRDRFVAGWRLALQCKIAGRRRVDFLIDQSFPYSNPSVFLLDRPALNEWPHVESDGKLCLWPPGNSLCGRTADDIAVLTLNQACVLLDECAAKSNVDDFRSEFLSYWRQSFVSGRPDLLSLLNPAPPTRPIFAWSCKDFTVVADNERDLHTWVQNRVGGVTSIKPRKGIFAWIGSPLLPSEYPDSFSTTSALLGRLVPDADTMLKDVAADAPGTLPVVIGALTDNGPCLAGIVLTKGLSKNATNGFRPGHVPLQLSSQRWLGTAKFSRAIVQRADSEWVHGRGHNSDEARLRASKVVIVGCGSLGGWIALTLVQSGVGSLVMVDPETMTTANAGRHVLGVDAFTAPKVVALAARLKRQFPDLVSCIPVQRRWQEARAADPAIFDGCDLVVAATGEWASDGPLNEWQLASGRKTPVLYTWTEAHACAGHAVLIGPSGGCLSCGFHADGRFRWPVTDWLDDQVMLVEPACGGGFTPYGPVELACVVNLASELALDTLLCRVTKSCHRVWAGRRTRLEAAGGSWTAAWVSGAPRREQGGFVEEVAWPAGPCAKCRGRQP